MYPSPSYLAEIDEGVWNKMYETRRIHARMAKLADALASGASGRKLMQVQVLFRALVLGTFIARAFSQLRILPKSYHDFKKTRRDDLWVFCFYL
jgi:hypothetical protein